jgi:hypothetical protein
MSTRTKEDAVRQARPGTGQIATHIRALEDDFRAEDRAYLRRKLAGGWRSSPTQSSASVFAPKM